MTEGTDWWEGMCNLQVLGGTPSLYLENYEGKNMRHYEEKYIHFICKIMRGIIFSVIVKLEGEINMRHYEEKYIHFICKIMRGNKFTVHAKLRG